MVSYRFTVFTPCYNSAAFIDRVFNSLKKQTFTDFEWYVINDASTDKTHQLIEEFRSSVDFRVVYHNLTKNQGYANNINQAVRDAKGEYWIIYGHDDEIVPEALETFDRLWKKYPDPSIGSIYALAKDQNHNLLGKWYPKDEFVSDYWTQFFALENEAEKFQCWKTQCLREFCPIITDNENGFTPMWLWAKVGGKYKSIFINKVLRTYYTNVATSMSKTMKRDQAPVKIFNYYRCWVNEFQYHIKNNWKRRLRGIGGYVSYGLLAKKKLHDILGPVNSLSNKILVLLFYPAAMFYNFIK